MAIQSIKDYLVRRGADHPLVRTALRGRGVLGNFRVEFSDNLIVIRKTGRELVLNKTQFIQVPFMMQYYDLFFDTFACTVKRSREVLDFSHPRVHRYKRTGVELHFPSIPEDDSMEAYTHWYTPQPGDVVWDVGAHAGATSYLLAQMVGPEGTVYSFEPDETNFQYLAENIERHDLQNVILIRKALAGHTGQVKFHMDGTMAAGIPDYIVYCGSGRITTVPCVTIADACQETGKVPVYAKLDIEGAEVAVIEAARHFLREHHIHFAIESNHRVDGEYTSKALDRLFLTIGYDVRSSTQFEQILFTWARPPAVASARDLHVPNAAA